MALVRRLEVPDGRVRAGHGAYLPEGLALAQPEQRGGPGPCERHQDRHPQHPGDAAGLFWTAIHADDPVFILIPKHIFRKQADVAKVEPVPLGRPRS